MRYGILGPLELSDDGRAIQIAGAKQRALLAILLLHANRVVSGDQLVEAIWEEQVPDSSLKALQVHVSQLRKLLGKHRLETRAPGYLLRVERDALDLERFQRLYGEGDLDEALSLWRGPPLAEFAFHRFAQPEIARLQELRLGCLEGRFDRDLALGRHAELVGELEGLVVEHPLREELRCQLMLALYRAGRQAEALDRYQQGRAALVDDLGVEPGWQLRELHQAILNQDASLDLPRQAPEPTDLPSVPSLSSTVEPVARNVRKTVTAVCFRVGFSSALGEGLDPEALRRVTGRAVGEVELAVVRHGGAIESVAGDAVTAIFGLPVVHEDDALRGVRAAAEARDALSVLAAELAAERALGLDFRIGISTGEVVTVIGAGAQLPTTGEPLSLSSRLAQVAGAAEVRFDEGSRQLLREMVVAEAASEGWSLLEVAHSSAIARRLVSPMVGRERECRRLSDAFEQAVGGRSCQLFTVLGLAGVGKSRLLQEFLDGIAGQAVVARGRCLPYGEGITYWPLLEAVNEAVGLDDTDSPDTARAKLVGPLGEGPEAELVARRVAEMIGLAEVSGGADEGLVAVRELFEALARSRPLVLVFDDIHWGEARFLDLIEHLANWVRDAPILLVCLARPELLNVRPSWGGGMVNATAALLEPLSAEECSQLIENLVGRAELVREVRTRIAEAADGNPLFVEEMLSMLIDDGLLVRAGGRWKAATAISTVRVPPTIQALLAARLDQLNESERAVIERASVVGKVFQEGAIAELSSSEALPRVAESLGTLVRKDLIRPERVSLGDRTYRFRHLLIRDAAYESIPKEVRAELHQRFGRWLEQTASDRGIEYEEVVGYHLEQAYRYQVELGAVDDAARAVAREAAERLGSAGRRAFVRSDAPAGANLIARAAALLPPDDPLRVELVPNVRVVQGLGGDMRWADRVLTEAVEAAATAGNRQLAARALVHRGLLRLFTESDVTAEELIDAADRSIAVFDELGDDLGLARAWRLKAQAHYLARRAGSCADASERAFDYVRRTEDRFEEQEIVEWLLIALLLGPAPAEAASRRCQLLLGEVGPNPLLEAQILATMGMLAAMRARLDEATELVVRSRAVMNDAGSQWIWIVTFWYAFISVWQGNPAEAEQELLPAYEALKKMGEKSHFSSITHALSNVLYLQGRYDEAEQLTRECEAVTRPNDIHSGILWRSIRSKILARRGEFAAAEQLAQEALAIASTSDFHIAHADALLDLAEVLALTGNPDATPALIRQAKGLYELKGNVLAAERAGSHLQNLDETPGQAEVT